MRLQLTSKTIALLFLVLVSPVVFSQEQEKQETGEYKKRVLETAEMDILTSFYAQDGDNAAVSGGLGTEELTDVTGTVIISIPLNDDDVLTIDAGISAYTSASSSNIDPFDGSKPADPFVASSGASESDTWTNVTGSYSHSSDDRNSIWSVKLSFSTEYDYTSFGAGGSYTRLFNEKNTELSVNASVYLDTWRLIYPIELRPFVEGGRGLDDPFFRRYAITGNPQYAPTFTEHRDDGRNSYALGVGFSQILSKKAQISLALDLVRQEGLLSTPFQRVYFADFEESFIENFHLADDVERLPDSRFKTALGARFNYYISEVFVLRTFYRYYFDDWGIGSHTLSVEVPIKLSDRFTIYPSYRFYNQTAADYFAPYNEHLSSDIFYTSDYDLSEYNANQFGFGVSYTDIFTEFNVWRIGFKSVDLKFAHYERNSGLTAFIVTGGFKFVLL